MRRDAAISHGVPGLRPTFALQTRVETGWPPNRRRFASYGRRERNEVARFETMLEANRKMT
jgi:hypothetical protein